MEFIYVNGPSGELPYDLQSEAGILRVVPLEAVTYIEFFFDTEILKNKKRKDWEAVTGASIEVVQEEYKLTPAIARRLYIKVTNTALSI